MAWFRRARRLKWAVVVSSPSGEAGEQWGDTWFGRDLVDALNRQGQDARLVYRGGANTEARDKDDVVLVLRGLRRVTPRRAGNTWLLWVISHPELVDDSEIAEYDETFAASATWKQEQVSSLLQATNPQRFTPAAGTADSGERYLFVGSTRGEYRPIVRDAIAAGIPLGVYGVGWSEFIPAEFIRAEFLPNDQLPAAYASAGVVLNDHWRDMADDGFLSNRLFDAVASGARVISDQAAGLEQVFGDAVVTYSSPESLREILHAPLEVAFADQPRRLVNAARIAAEHSFDARAAELVVAAQRIRGSA
jgi:hypothetical protein